MSPVRARRWARWANALASSGSRAMAASQSATRIASDSRTSGIASSRRPLASRTIASEWRLVASAGSSGGDGGGRLVQRVVAADRVVVRPLGALAGLVGLGPRLPRLGQRHPREHALDLLVEPGGEGAVALAAGMDEADGRDAQPQHQ